MRIKPSNVREKKKGTTKCDKIIVKCYVSNTRCDNETIKYEKKIKEPLNVTRVQLNVMFVLHNVIMKLSNVKKKKKKELLNVTKILSNVMLVQSNVTMEPSNVRKNK